MGGGGGAIAAWATGGGGGATAHSPQGMGGGATVPQWLGEGRGGAIAKARFLQRFNIFLLLSCFHCCYG